MSENKTLIVSELKVLYPKVYDEYMNEQRIQGNNPDDSVKITRPAHVGGMSWENSRLKYDFWSHINKGRLAEAKQIAPELFMEDEQFKLYSFAAKELAEKHKSIAYNEKLAKDLILGSKYQDVGIQKKARKLSVELIKKVEIEKGLAYRIELELKSF